MVVESRKCVVHLLTTEKAENKLEIHLQPKLLCSDLMDIVCSHFSLKEKEYFGLCFFDNRDNRCWLRPDKKTLDHNFQKTNPIQLYFAVRIFIPSVSILKNNITIELFYLQARQLIFKGDLDCDSETSFLLAAYVLQATHGDYVSDAIGLEDLKTKDVLPVKTLEEHPTSVFREQKILDYYQKLDGIGKTEAVLNYLGIVESLPMYGVHYHNVKDKSQVSWKLGVSYHGVAMYDYQNKTSIKKTYQWTHMENMYYRDKKFSMEYSETLRSGGNNAVKKQGSNGLNRINSIRRSISQKVKLYSYYCSSSSACREIWYLAVSHHKFHIENKNITAKLTDSLRYICGILLLSTTLDHLSPMSIKQISRTLSRSVTSLSSMRSLNSTKDNISDSTSYYFSLDGESISSSQRLAAEQDMVAALTQRKAFLEQQLLEKKELLNDICLREAELTGVPACDLPDSPTHPGLPMRRKVGTAFEFDESILKPTTTCNMEDRELDNLQRDYEIQRQISHAAQRLARDPAAKKALRKTREASYQKSLIKLKTMEQQLEYYKRETARETFEGLTKLTRKDEAGSQGDSLGPIDVETSSNKSNDSVPDIPIIRRQSTSTAKKRARESMYLAAPVVHSSSIPINTLTFLNDRLVRSPINNSIISPRYDADTDSYLEYTDNFISDDSSSLCRSMSVRMNNRTRGGHHRPSLVKIKSQFHNSAGHIDELISPDDDVTSRKYLCDEFANTGVYSSVNKDDFASNPAIPNCFTIDNNSNSNHISNRITQLDASPQTLRRLKQLSLSPASSSKHLAPSSRYNNNNCHSYSSVQSISSIASSEQSEEYWNDQSEETLV